MNKEIDPTLLFFAGIELLPLATTAKAKPDDVAKWVEQIVASAGQRGPRLKLAAKFRTADLLANQDGFPELALKLSEALVKETEKAKTAKKVQALKTLASVQRKSKLTEELKSTLAAIDRLELVLDSEYKAEVPPFKVEKYAGRKDKLANRVAVLELFTGAQCPPCVAADIAFDALETAYERKDLILVQYHMHIPGPDPMTNAESQARWDYYGEIYNTSDDPNERPIGGVPSSLFNGKPLSGGGGPMALSEEKFKDFARIANELLEAKTEIAIAGTASKKDGTLTVNATVTGTSKDASPYVRVLLVEEEVHFPGGNGVRFHHQVLRSMFGKAGGWKASSLKDGKLEVSLKLAELKESLAKTIDADENELGTKFAKKPLALEHLKVIVLVQKDESGEILQAAQFDVK